MKLIEPDEVEDFRTILRKKHIDIDDFALFEIDTTDPKSDEIFALQGRLTVVRKSNGLWKHYPIGDGMAWVSHFQKDLDEGVFG